MYCYSIFGNDEWFNFYFAHLKQVNNRKAEYALFALLQKNYIFYQPKCSTDILITLQKGVYRIIHDKS